MTNGEKIKSLFNPYKICEYEYSIHIYMTENDFWNADYQINCNADWWNAEYKEPKEIHLIPIGEEPKEREIAKTILRAQIYCDYKRSHGECLQECENCGLSYLMGTNESHDNALKLALKSLENESKWIKAIEDIKTEVSRIIDEIDYQLMDIDISACNVDHFNREKKTVKGILELITERTKELM